MSDPMTVVETWLSQRLETDPVLNAMLPGGFHEGMGFDVPDGAFCLITFGRTEVMNTYRTEALYTVPFTIAVQAVGATAAELSPAMARINELLIRQPAATIGDAVVSSCVRSQIGRSIFPSPYTGKRETQSTYRAVVTI